MASTIKYGSRGDEVSQLQALLNQQGYNLAVDGIFGSATQNAVRQYQQSMGLTVDGIVGANTWGALTGSSGSGGSSSYNPGYTFDQLLAELNRNTYIPLSEQEIMDQARAAYDPIYNANREGLTQAAEQYYLALEQQLAGLGTAYDRQREDTAQAFADVYSEADRQSLSRGMQRSSYTGQTLANINTQGAKAQDDISAAQTQAETNLYDQRTLYEQQLGQSLTRLAADYETNVASYANQLRNQERERELAAQQYGNQLALSLYQAAMSQAQWEAQFAENQRQFNASLAASQRTGGSNNKNNDNTPYSDNNKVLDFLCSLYGKPPTTEVNKWGVGGSVHSAWVANGSPSGGIGNAISDKGELVYVDNNNTPKRISGGKFTSISMPQ